MEIVDKIKKAAPLIALIVLLIIFMFGYEFYAYKKSDVFGSAKLSWNANADEDLAGYKIYYGASPRTGNCPQDSGYTGSIDVGSATSYTISNLENGKTYYFSVSAYDRANNESCFGQETNKSITASKKGLFKYFLGK